VNTPDVLVLGVGGILGEAWTSSLLAGLAEGGEFAPGGCDVYLGTSAGSIVAALLCGGVELRDRLGRLPEQPPADAPDAESDAASAGASVLQAASSAATAAIQPFASLALRGAAPGGQLLRRAALSRVPRGRRSLAELGREIERSGATWDGRLRIAVVELESGRRVIFDGSGNPAIEVGQAVEASCAIPGVFRPVEIDGRHYVDGGAWSPTNMDTLEVAAGTRVLCLNPTAALRPTRRAPAGVFGTFSRSLAAIEAAALRRRGAEVTIVEPDRRSVAAMGPNMMSPRRREQVVAAGITQGRELAAA
jgi:NTE family protein